MNSVQRYAIIQLMKVTVSDKYQLVVPKEARKKMGLKPGQKVTVKNVQANTITFEREPTMQELLAQSRGTMQNTPWQKDGVDASKWLRQERDRE